MIRVLDRVAPELPEREEEYDSYIEGSAIERTERENELEHNFVYDKHHLTVRVLSRCQFTSSHAWLE